LEDILELPRMKKKEMVMMNFRYNIKIVITYQFSWQHAQLDPALLHLIVV
jgi:hypothetical protein